MKKPTLLQKYVAMRILTSELEVFSKQIASQTGKAELEGAKRPYSTERSKCMK